MEGILGFFVNITRENITTLKEHIKNKEKFELILGNAILKQLHVPRMEGMRAQVAEITKARGEVPKCEHKTRSLITNCLSCFSRSFGMNPACNNWDFTGNNNLLPDNAARTSLKKFYFFCMDDFHLYQTTPGSLSRSQGRTTGCPYCASHELCSDKSCKPCKEKSYQSHNKSACWLQDKNNGIIPRDVFLNCNTKYWHKCGECFHEFKISPEFVNRNHWCSFCVNLERCPDEKCSHCFNNSFASHHRAKYWDYEKNSCAPRDVARSSNKKYYFNCVCCGHSFRKMLSTIYLNDEWCPYCASKKLCLDKQCSFCYNNSFESHYRAKYWDYDKNGDIKPRNVFKASNESFFFLCEICTHSFGKNLYDITKTNGEWCPFCGTKKLCLDNCSICYERSYSSVINSKFWNWEKNNNINPRHVRKWSHNKYYHDCNKCGHSLYMALYTISRGSWCKFCLGEVCGEDDCKICDEACVACQTRKARKITRKSKKFLCLICFDRCCKEDPAETPLQKRAKISLEIYCLAELQRLALQQEDSFLIAEPTVWDCPILPGLPYKLDNAWFFDKFGNIFHTVGACKINTNEVSYILALEVLEGSIRSHSAARDIPDAQREKEIRQSLYPIPMGFVYLTVAHTKHNGTNSEDVFFAKNVNGEYEVLEDRQEAWETRITTIRDKLIEFYVDKSNETCYIGN